ncbi:MAG: hypothetical protein QM811_27040 [Pirellulales bacterium]
MTKVIYLPDAEFQELALAGVETLVSTRLDPGVDPIVEADRKGTILAIIRLGNKNLQAPGAVGGAIVPAGFSGGLNADGSACGPDGCPGGCGPGGGQGAASQYLAGITAPAYGMPITGTPIGLPGPPHIPLGAPAGLQQHVIRNHTHMHIPAPVEKFSVDVKQKPGLSYPKPVHNVHIVERNQPQRVRFSQPAADKIYNLPGEEPPVAARHGHHCRNCPPEGQCDACRTADGAVSDYDAQ